MSGRYKRSALSVWIGAGLTVFLSGALSGCSGPSMMRLSPDAPVRAGHLVWWKVGFPIESMPPILGVELCRGNRRTEQWILCEHGVRRFRYERAMLVSAGPPLSPSGLPEEMAFVRAWLTHYPRRVDPSYALAARALTDIRTMADAVRLLETSWKAREVAPPSGLNAHEIAYESEYFYRDVFTLLRMAEEMGW